MIGTPEEARAWCLYLAAIHRAVSASGQTVFLPTSYQCTRRPGALTGCGCCYQCTKALIGRALYTSTCPQGETEQAAQMHAENVFRYVVSLDERLAAPDGLNDDYAKLDSRRFAKVMQWAGEMPPLPERIGSSAHQAAAADQATAPAYRPTECRRQQLYTCPECRGQGGDATPDGNCAECKGNGYVIWDPNAPQLEPAQDTEIIPVFADPVEVESLFIPYDAITASRAW